MKKIFEIHEFNWNVINISFYAIGVGFIYRRVNPKQHKAKWFKITWNEPYNCYATKVCSFGELFTPHVLEN